MKSLGFGDYLDRKKKQWQHLTQTQEFWSSASETTMMFIHTTRSETIVCRLPLCLANTVWAALKIGSAGGGLRFLTSLIVKSSGTI